MNPDFLKKLAEITAHLRRGITLNGDPLGELQKRAKQAGEDFGYGLEKQHAQAGYAKAHPESRRAQEEMLTNGAVLALSMGTGERPTLVPAIKTLEGKVVDGITHAHAYGEAGITTPLPPKYEGYTDPSGKFYTRQAAEKLMKNWMSPSVKAQVAERSRHAGKDMGITTEDLNGKLYANRGTRADAPMTLEDMDRIVAESKKRKGAAMDSVPAFTERVISAALRANDGKIFSAPTHGEAFNAAESQGYSADSFDNLSRSSMAASNGFVTNKGRFVSRKEAYKLAKNANAIEGPDAQTSDNYWKDRLAAENFSPDPNQVSGDALFRDLHDKGGFTYDASTWQPVSTGYSVGGGNKSGVILKTPLSELTPDHLAEFLKKNKDKIAPGQAWGGWVDNGHAYIEPADQVADLNAAQRLGNERGEKAIWDHANKSEIPLKAAKRDAEAAQRDQWSVTMDKWRSVWGDFENVGNDIKNLGQERRASLLAALRTPDFIVPQVLKPK